MISSPERVKHKRFWTKTMMRWWDSSWIDAGNRTSNWTLTSSDWDDRKCHTSDSCWQQRTESWPGEGQSSERDAWPTDVKGIQRLVVMVNYLSKSDCWRDYMGLDWNAWGRISQTGQYSQAPVLKYYNPEEEQTVTTVWCIGNRIRSCSVTKNH